MADSQNRRLMELFDATLDMTPEEQDELLLRVKTDRPQLGQRLAALIAGHRAPLDHRLQVANVARWSSSGRESASSTVGPTGGLDDVRVHAGMMVDRYQLIRELGRGGMGSVFLARDTRLGRLAAIKFLRVTHPGLVQRFIAEARATALCSHDNIVIVYEADEFQGIPYMALEYLEGQTLRQFMSGQGPGEREAGAGDCLALSAERVVGIAISIVRALQRAHEMGIIHRDLKPENVMFTDAGTVKVLDFGIAKLLDGYALASPPSRPKGRDKSTGERALAEDLHSAQAGGRSCAVEPPLRPNIGPVQPDMALRQTELNLSVTNTGALMGTLPYMSPEQLRGQTVDARTDVWAVGVILFEMLTGRHPLDPISRAGLYEILDPSTPMPRLGELRPDLGALADIVDGCLVKPLTERIASADQLLAALCQLGTEPIEPVTDVDRSPFNGLSAFQEADAGRFFGRSEDIAAVVARVRTQPMVAVLGPSGVGKSSLVRAGVIPELKRAGEGWHALIIRPGREPLASLSGLLKQLGRESAATEVRGQIADRLRAEPGYLGAELRWWASSNSRRVLIFIDQFEELFTLNVAAAERGAFLACLSAIADDASSPLRVVFSMRSDFIERLAETRAFMTRATRGLVLLPPIDRAGLREALVRPLAAVRYQFENEQVIESILDALEGRSGALPLLQFTAAHLWRTRDRVGRLLTERSYRSMGGIAGALARHADAILTGMSRQGLLLTRRIFERLVTPERTRAIVSVTDLRQLASAADGIDADDIERVLQELVDARLVVVDTSTSTGDGAGLVEVVHESLIASWPTLHRWLDENQEDAVFLGRLRAAATEWGKSGEAQGMLWRGDTEREARRWWARYKGSLAERERRFLAAVFALADRATRRRRIVVSAIIVCLSLISVTAIAGLLSIQAAERESKRQADNAERQLQAYQRENAAKKQAEKEREAALAEVQASRENLRATLAEEQESRKLAERERQRAEEALQLARRAQRRAVQAQREAERAQRVAERAQREAERAARAEAMAKLELQRLIRGMNEKTVRINALQD